MSTRAIRLAVAVIAAAFPATSQVGLVLGDLGHAGKQAGSRLSRGILRTAGKTAIAIPVAAARASFAGLTSASVGVGASLAGDAICIGIDVAGTMAGATVGAGKDLTVGIAKAGWHLARWHGPERHADANHRSLNSRPAARTAAPRPAPPE